MFDVVKCFCLEASSLTLSIFKVSTSLTTTVDSDSQKLFHKAIVHIFYNNAENDFLNVPE